MEQSRAAAKRRASFGRADRLRKEEQRKAEQTKSEQARKADRAKADEQRKAIAAEAVKQRTALSQKRADQRRLARKQENLKKEFARKAEDSRARDTQAQQQRKAASEKVAQQKQAAERDPKVRDAANYVAQQEQRQARDQQDEHRRQTGRMRALHNGERLRNHEREAGAVIDHARKIRNIDIAERRELEALDVQRRSLTGRVTGMVRGAGHFARQEQAIAERHEADRWRSHHDHEVTKDKLFWSAQATRLVHVGERRDMAKTHEVERQGLKQAQERARPQQIEARVQAVTRANDNTQKQQLEKARPTQAFGHAAGQSHEIKR